MVGHIDTDSRVDGNGAIYDKNFYISNMNGDLLRADLKNDEIVWKKSLIPKVMVTPTISGSMGNIWVPQLIEGRQDRHFISALSHSDGEMYARIGNYYASTPFAIADDSVFFPHLRENNWYISKMSIPMSIPDDESLRELQNLFDDAIKGIGNNIIIPILDMLIYDLLKSRRDEIKLVIQGEETNIDRDSIEDRLNEVYDKLVNKNTQSIEESYNFIRRIWKFMNSDDKEGAEGDDLDNDS